MGTSSSGGGAGGNNPLIPKWIDNGGLPPPLPPPIPPPLPPPEGDEGDDGSPDGQNDQNNAIPASDQSADGNNFPEGPAAAGAGGGNRYTPSRRSFNKYVRSGGTDRDSLKQALKTYSRSAAGTTSGLARRMRPSTVRIATFYDTIGAIRSRGAATALTDFNLTAFISQPLLDTLSALSEVIFSDTGKAYEDTQDDSITKAAYANTVMRVCESSPDLDLDNLNDDQVEDMVAIFIEETIAQRVINDIGNEFLKTTTDIQVLLEIENGIYQVVSGLVRNQIMPQIRLSRVAGRDALEQNIESIYRTAFDTMAGLNY